MTQHLEGGRSRHKRPGRTSTDPDRVPLPGGEEWIVRGACAGCQFSVNGFVRESMLRQCPGCSRALCLICYAGRANNFPAAGTPCVGCQAAPAEVAHVA